jgi:hypothetical protein
MRLKSVIRGLLLAGICPVLLAGCAAQQRADTRAGAAAKLPWWVASPSAPLPEGFPPPGPLDEVIIKEYPAYRAAVAHRSAEGRPSPASPEKLFFPLFNHIETLHIAMSAPVEITYKNRQPAKVPPMESMAFIYGSPTIGATGKDGPVEVVDVAPARVASVGVIGDYDEAHLGAGKVKLDAWLAAHAAEYTAAGKPRHLAYNSPFVLPFMRYSEVQIPISPVQQN